MTTTDLQREPMNWQKECLEYVGRSQIKADKFSPHAANYLLATLNEEPDLSDGDAIPALFHWLYFNGPVRSDNLKIDGHEKLGSFLPPVPYPRRMWAGSKLSFHHPLVLGKKTERCSTIKAIEFKSGSSGPLCFVKVEHVFTQEDKKCLSDLQTIVYRESSGKNTLQPEIKETSGEVGANRQSIDSVVMFRYSALTFNSHRIHYDHKYVREVEGYPGLVVHGPLMATLLMRHAQQQEPSKAPSHFSFRGLAPVFEGENFLIESEISGDDLVASLVKADGTKAVGAVVSWQA